MCLILTSTPDSILKYTIINNRVIKLIQKIYTIKPFELSKVTYIFNYCISSSYFYILNRIITAYNQILNLQSLCMQFN